MEEFLFREITVLERANLLDNELLHRNFRTFFIVIVDSQITLLIVIHRSLGKNGKNILKG